jgi:hypothetical protein
VFRRPTRTTLLLETYANQCSCIKQAGTWNHRGAGASGVVPGTTHEPRSTGAAGSRSRAGGTTPGAPGDRRVQQTATRHGLDWNSSFDATPHDNFTVTANNTTRRRPATRVADGANSPSPARARRQLATSRHCGRSGCDQPRRELRNPNPPPRGRGTDECVGVPTGALDDAFGRSSRVTAPARRPTCVVVHYGLNDATSTSGVVVPDTPREPPLTRRRTRRTLHRWERLGG